MADFCVSAVRYDKTGQHIEWLKVHQDMFKGIGPERLVQRAFIVDLIKLQIATFVTVTIDPDTQMRIDGARIHVVDGRFLTTDCNDSTRDNLAELPGF